MPPHYPSPTELTHLPNEIMLLIGESLGVPALSNMMKTNSRYASLFHSLLHEKAATFNVKGNTPAIAWAAEQGRPSMIKWILDGAKKPITPSAIILALFMACYYNDTDMVEMLLPVTPSVPLCSTNTGAKYFFVGVQSQNMTEKTRNKYVSEDNDLSAHLYVASRNGSEEIVWMLFKFGMRDFAKSRALLAIAEEGLDEAAKILLDAGMKHDPEAVSRAVFSAVIGENVNMVRILMDSGAKFEMPVMAYHTAMRKLTGEMDKVLLQLRDGIRLPDMTPIFAAAAYHGNYFYIKTMIDLGDKCPLESAVFAPALRSATGSARASEKMIRLILNAGEGHIIEDDLSQALYTIVKYERPVITNLLLQRGADSEKVFETGTTALHMATLYGHNATAKVLVESGTNVSIKAENGQTALHIAAHNNFYAIAKRLIESGADISVTDNKDLTPLHLAANNGSYEVARLLLEHGADPWAQSPKGWMPLNLAAIKKHDCVLELLLATQKVAFSIEERERIIRVMGNRYPDF
ncbi:hypothetical protein McanMca71_000997 [Microsporum canis]